MPDLHDRFRTLDRLPAPYLWHEVLRRAEGSVATAPVSPVSPVRSDRRRSGDSAARGQRPMARQLALIAALGLLVASLVGGAVLVGASLLPAPSTPLPPGPGAFFPTGSLAQARWGHTATLLHDGRVLVLGGSNGHGPFYVGDAAAVETFDPALGTFSTAGTLVGMHTISGVHTATLLPDGRVLVVGGGRTNTSLADLWDPATGTFIATGPLIQGRADHTATLLADGRVLIVGGTGDSGPLVSAELWDPTTGTFSAAGALLETRSSFTASLLPDGRVLVVGGSHDVPVALEPAASPDTLAPAAIAAAEIWDPVTRSFSPAPPPTQARTNATATVLSDGRILIAGGGGGDNGDLLASAELWDPASETFTPTGSMIEPRIRHTATLLKDGRVLIAGGQAANGLLASAELWDPSTGTFSPTEPLEQARGSHTATLLADGRILIAGGDGNAPTDPAEGNGGTLASAELFQEWAASAP